MAIDFTVTQGSSSANLVSNPIQPAWILEGKPAARIALLTSSADGTASTYFWDCTAGRFNWYYSFDETFHILEGEISLKDACGASRRVVAGDTVFFPVGSSAEWTVPNYVRKLAFCRIPVPASVTFARKCVRAVRSALRGGSKDSGSGLL